LRAVVVTVTDAISPPAAAAGPDPGPRPVRTWTAIRVGR
jgi:hypothetical protein